MTRVLTTSDSVALRRHWSLVLVSCGLGLVLLVGCPDDPEPGGGGDSGKGGKGSATAAFEVTEAMVTENNRGVGLMEQYKYQEAMKLFQGLVDDNPSWLDAKVNLAIAVLNQTQKGASAVPILEDVVAADPDHAAATYCLGISLFHATRIRAAQVQFQKAVKQDPLDAHSAYFLARCLEEKDPEEATRWYQKALELEPYFQSAHYRCWDLLRQVEKFEESGKHMEEFTLLREHPLSVAFEYKYTVMGPKANAIRVALSGDPRPSSRPAGPVFAPPSPISAAGDFRASSHGAVTTCDINGDGHQDLFLAGTKGNLVLLGTGGAEHGGAFQEVTDHPLAGVTNVTAPLWGDFDNDGLVDVYLCRAGPNQLWRQVKEGTWEDITEKAGAAGPDAETVDGAFLDLDHDADLDLLLVHSGQPAQLLNNDRDGTFQDISKKTGVDRKGIPTAGMVVADLDGDRDLDILLLGPSGKAAGKPSPNDVLWNDRSWRYHVATLPADLSGLAIDAAVAGDVDVDGQVDLITVSAGRVSAWVHQPGGKWAARPYKLGDGDGVIGEGQARLLLADVTGDGRLELVAGSSGFTAWAIPTASKSGAADEPLSLIRVGDSGEHEPLSVFTSVVAEHARGPALVGTLVDGSPMLWAAGPGRHPFVSVALSGKKKGRYRERSNASGLGNIVTARVGGTAIRVDSLPSDSGGGQSLQPVSFGLAGKKQADYVKVTWSEGVTQGQLGLVAGQRHEIVEVDLMPTSCPVLFAWDGNEYRFVSDLLAVGGMGYLIEPGTYAPSDPSENFLLPAGLLRPTAGRLKLKLTEPMPELTYLDRVALVAWDVPAGWQIVLDERLATALPDPSGRPLAYRVEQPPVKVTNDRDEDVTARVRARDNEAADVGGLDHRFLGRLAGEHVLVMEFEKPLDDGSGRPVLVADGWVEFPYSQTAFAAWQSGARFDAPTLEARDSQGRWVEVASQFGYPGGMPRQMAFPLPVDKLPSGTTALRLRTNLEIYWDRLTVVRQEECPGLIRKELPLVSSDLRESGFMVRQLKEQYRPHFDYGLRAQHPEIVDPNGFYTRFGDVRELVGTADDAVAIFGPGEEIHLEFGVPDSPVKPGWTRRLVLETVGWCKDMDLYTGDGSTVGPLPTSGQPVGPRDRLHRKYNTRYQRGW